MLRIRVVTPVSIFFPSSPSMCDEVAASILPDISRIVIPVLKDGLPLSYLLHV